MIKYIRKLINLFFREKSSLEVAYEISEKLWLIISAYKIEIDSCKVALSKAKYDLAKGNLKLRLETCEYRYGKVLSAIYILYDLFNLSKEHVAFNDIKHDVIEDIGFMDKQTKISFMANCLYDENIIISKLFKNNTIFSN